MADFGPLGSVMNITEKQVLETFESPLAIESHELSEDTNLLFYRRDYAGKHPSSLIVQVLGEDGKDLAVVGALRYYHVLGKPGPSCMDMLKDFTENFGLDIAVGDKKGKLLGPERMREIEGVDNTPTVVGKQATHGMATSFFFRVTTDKEGTRWTEVALAYALDIWKFKTWKTSVGIH